jgi:hypothetical protein
MTQLITTYDMTGSVPQREVELYDATYSVLFEYREAVRGFRRSQGLSPQQLGRLVSYLAYQLKARTDVSGMPKEEFLRLLGSYPYLPGSDFSGDNDRTWRDVGSTPQMRQIGNDVAVLDLPVRRTLGDAPDGELRWSVTRDAFSEYLAARWILNSHELAERISRLMTMIETGEFAAGSQFVVQSAARSGDHQGIVDYARKTLIEDTGRLTGTTRSTLAQMLASID